MAGLSKTLKEEIALGERKDGGGLACDEMTVDAHFVGFGVYGDFGRGAIVHQVFFPDIAAICNGGGDFLQSKLLRQAGGERGLGQERDARGGGNTAERAEHRPVENRLRRGNRRARVTHGIPGDKPSFDDHLGLHAEECRLPKNEVGELAGFDRADFGGDAVGDGGIDGVLCDVALGAVIIVARGIFRERAALRFHFMRGLPGANDDFADAAHGLGIARDHAEDAHVVEDVFGGDGFRANAAFGEGDIFRNVGIQVVADHEHVEVFGDRVDREGAGGIRGRRQDIGD